MFRAGNMHECVDNDDRFLSPTLLVTASHSRSVVRSAADPGLVYTGNGGLAGRAAQIDEGARQSDVPL